jgi:suppressor of G2 allele of SKP1
MGTKIEITLQKQKAGQKWSALEGSSTATTQLADRPAAPTAPAASGPAYPTSSRKGAKDWDQVASSLTEKKSKGKSTAGVDEGSDDEFGGDAVDGFFKKLYANADPETRRAMIKSYTESQGTSLSTNWSEVAKGKVEAHPN